MKSLAEYLKLNNEVLNTYQRTGEIDRDKDIEAARKYFLDEINTKTVFFHSLKEKLDYLVENDYYEKDFLEKYSFEDIKQVFQTAYSYKFRFPSFMSASKFYSTYPLMTRDGKHFLERYEDRISVVALVLAKGDIKKALKYVKYVMESYQPATPSVLNLGKKARGEYVSCYKLSIGDSMNNISYNINNALQLSKIGGGVGLSLTDIRPAGDPIKGIENRASGIMPVAKLLENSFSYANQLGTRQGSGVIWLSIFHADIQEFLSAKKPNADEKIQLVTLSTGVVIPDIFFELAKQDKDMFLFSPYDIYKEYGVQMSDFDMTKMYYELLDNPNIRKIKRVNARRMYTDVKKTQIESGYPFEMYWDTVNDNHPLKNLGKVKISNLCTEVLQYQANSEIGYYGEEDQIGFDVSCNLGSIDIHNAVKTENFSDLIKSAMEMLTEISVMTDIKQVPSVAKGNRMINSVGLGVMNLHGHLMDNEIRYGSKESLNFVDIFFEAINYHSLKASNEIAKERNEFFYGFEESEYKNGNFFKQYLEKRENSIESEKVKKALGNVTPITREQWVGLKESIQKYGLFHGYRLCTAPTGSISYIRSSTASASPITQRVEVRDYADSRTIYPMPFLTKENADKYIEAYDMDMYEMIDLYATAQKHIDQALSMTLYITDQWTTEELAKLYIYAWARGIKTVYYVRQRTMTIDECVSCTI